jgi:glycopeptide antibiotics resistance protein
MYSSSYELTPPVFMIVFALISFFIIKRNYKRTQVYLNRAVLVHLTFSFYVLVMINLFILPICIPGEGYDAVQWQHISFLQLRPFVTINQMLSNGNWFIQILGNIGLCIPVPFFLYYYTKKMTVSLHLIFGLFLAISFELSQFIINILSGFPNRVVDVDDVILNVFGVLLGYVVMRVIKTLHKHLIKSDSIQV